MLIGIILCAAPFILFLGIHNFVMRVENFLRDKESTESANFHKKPHILQRSLPCMFLKKHINSDFLLRLKKNLM